MSRVCCLLQLCSSIVQSDYLSSKQVLIFRYFCESRMHVFTVAE